MRSKDPRTWVGKRSGDDLLNPFQASDVLGGNISELAVRKRVREGALKCYWRQETPGLIFVKRSELLALYAHKIDKWKGVKK
jgi:hypothetical protein